jgi:N-methylhydantoinase A
VTDADLALGRLEPGAALGGGIHLDVDAAIRAIEPLASHLGVSAVEAAAGIVRVADAQMADLIRTVTIERGHDPRAFTLVAYGGAGPVHVGRFAADVGVREAIVPRSASVYSAVGLASADYRRTYKRSRRLRLPLDPGAVGPIVLELRHQAETDFAASGLDGRLALVPWVDVRYRRQTHQLRVPSSFDARGGLEVASLEADFEATYARTFGIGTGYAAAGIEATAIGLHAVAPRETKPAGGLPGGAPARSGAETRRPVRRRRVWFDGWVDDAPIYAAASLQPGSSVDGPAVIEWGSTSLVVHPGQRTVIDDDGNARLQVDTAVTR